MGSSSSSLSELASNKQLAQFASSDSISPNDPFWNQLLSFSFDVPRNSADQRLLEESTNSICKTFAINNCQTGNFRSLLEVFLVRATELRASAQCDDDVFTWQTYNALVIIRNLAKYFVENLSEEVAVQQFETTPTTTTAIVKGGVVNGAGSVLEDLINCLVEILIDVPVTDVTYVMHVECVSTLLVLLAVQMYQTTPATKSRIFHALMQGKSSIHACLLMKTLVQRFSDQQPCPAAMRGGQNGRGGIYGITTAVASGLWSVMTLGLAGGGKSDDGGGKGAEPDTVLANQSLLLILVLANHCTSEAELHNPYREALFSFTNSQDETTCPSQAVATFKTDSTRLYAALCRNLRDDQTTLLLYLLLHRNVAVRVFILSRTNLEQLVVPLLRVLYTAQEKNSHHIYMALIVLLILSEDNCFNEAVHKTLLKNITWFKERHISEITLGGLLILVVIRTIQYNMTKMRDKYLHTNCLAVLANMSAFFEALHPYVSQRLISLFALLLKKHTRLVEQIRQSAVGGSTGDDASPGADHVEDLGVLEEVIRMVLEIINSCLSHALHRNPNLVYTLLYQRALFAHFRTHPTFQDIIQNIDTVLNYFTARLDEQNCSIGVTQVLAVIKQGAMQFKRERLKKFPELRFKYVEEDAPEEFFSPYVWSLVFHCSSLFFDPSRIRIFALPS